MEYNRRYADNDNYIVEFVRQNEVQDIFSVYNKATGEKEYHSWPRSCDMSATDLLESID
jgi:hypothetical protein